MVTLPVSRAAAATSPWPTRSSPGRSPSSGSNLGDMHPEVGDDLREFGAIALARRDYAAAEQNYRAALLRYENAGPVPQWRGAPALVGLATALARRGDVRQADSLLALVIPSLSELETNPSSLQLAARQLRASLKSPSILSNQAS